MCDTCVHVGLQVAVQQSSYLHVSASRCVNLNAGVLTRRAGGGDNDISRGLRVWLPWGAADQLQLRGLDAVGRVFLVRSDCGLLFVTCCAGTQRSGVSFCACVHAVCGQRQTTSAKPEALAQPLVALPVSRPAVPGAPHNAGGGHLTGSVCNCAAVCALQGPFPCRQLPVHHKWPAVCQRVPGVLVQAAAVVPNLVDACGQHCWQHRVLALQFLWVLCPPCSDVPALGHGLQLPVGQLLLCYCSVAAAAPDLQPTCPVTIQEELHVLH